MNRRESVLVQPTTKINVISYILPIRHGSVNLLIPCKKSWLVGWLVLGDMVGVLIVNREGK